MRIILIICLLVSSLAYLHEKEVAEFREIEYANLKSEKDELFIENKRLYVANASKSIEIYELVSQLTDCRRKVR